MLDHASSKIVPIAIGGATRNNRRIGFCTPFGITEINLSVKSLPTNNKTSIINIQGMALKATTETSGKALCK